MYNLEQKIIDAFNSDSREIYVKAVFNNDFTVDGEYIKSFTINNSIGGTEALTLGNAYSNRLELNMFVPEDFTGLSKSKIEIYAGIMINNEVSYVPLGVFFAEEVKSTDNFKSVKITAYDAMLKINELGNTYKCSNTSANITPINIIKDIAKQAGVTVNIGDSVDTITDKNIQKAVGIHYGSDGSVQESLSSVGVKELIALPQGSSSITIKFTGDNLYELQYGDFNVIYYTDAKGENVHSYETFDSMTFSDVFDTDDNGVLSQWVEGTITRPSYNGTLYMGFSFNSSSFDELPELKFETEFTYPQINYVNNSAIPNPNSVDFSARTMLGYMAGLLGCNAVINRSGALMLKRFSVNTLTSISAEEQYMNGYEQTLETPLTIDYLTTGTEPNSEGEGGVITVGQGSYGFNFENPYITTSAKALNILNMYKGLQIMPCKIKYRGNPCFDCGDIIKAEDRNGAYQNVLILSQSLSVSGGFSSTIDCTLKTDVKSDFISTPSTKKLAQRFNDFERAYQDVISKLFGVSGGYVKDVYDSQGNRRAIAICENDIAVKWDSTAEKVVVENSSDSGEAMWVWSYGGLRFTRNGGANYEVAMNMKGQIYANYLLSPEGSIGGWEIGEDCLYKNYGNYRTLIQTPKDNSTGVFAVKDMTTGTPTFYINAMGSARFNRDLTVNGKAKVDGELTVNGKLIVNQYVLDDFGWEIMNTNYDSGLVIGAGCYQNGQTVYYQGGKIFIRFSDEVVLREGNTELFDISQGYSYNGVSMPTIHSKKDFLIGAPEGKAIFLSASGGVYSLSKFIAEGTIKANANIVFSNGAVIQTNDASYKHLEVGGVDCLDLYGTSYIQAHNDFRLKFSAVSGTVPLVVNTSGVITATTSSERYKENIITELDDVLNPHKLYDLPVVQYNYKNKFKDKELVEGTQIGITAEGVHKHYPNACIYNEKGEPESWQDRIMIPAMLKLIQEQKKMIDHLEKRIEALEKRQN